MIYISSIIAAAVTMLLTALFLHSSAARKIQDVPNERSLHTKPIPRIGGVALIAGVLSGWSVLTHALPWWILMPVLLLFTVSIMDDMRGLSVRYRLLAHLLAAFMLVQGTGLFAQHVLPGMALLLLVVWMTNLYNFMDGSDGLAGGMAFIGFGIYGIAALHAQYVPFALLNFSIVAAAAGFLYFNFYPAKIFMGDAGSIPLGFLAAAMGLWGMLIGLWPAWFPLLVFSPFIVDASVTLLKRALRKEKIWQAHREHYYQRLVQLGWGHRKTALAEYGLMLAAGSSALLAVWKPVHAGGILLSWGLIFLILMLLIERLWKKRTHE